MCDAYSAFVLGFDQMPVISPVKHDGCPAPHTAKEDRHIYRLGDFPPKFVRRRQNAARRLSIVAKVKNHLQPVHPVLAPHFFNRNDPSSFDHFFTSIFCTTPSICQEFGTVLEFF
jgi:hypothetical protein